MTKKFEDKMVSAVKHLESEYSSVRAGRANPGVLDKVIVDYYGVATPINQVATVSVTEARTLSIQPWDRSLLKAVVKAIQMSDVGINPIDDGISIRLVFPAPTEERRKELVKTANKRTEEARVSIRNMRRDIIDGIKKAEKAKQITEDDSKEGQDKAQKLTDKMMKEIDKVIAAKEKEIMEV